MKHAWRLLCVLLAPSALVFGADLTHTDSVGAIRAMSLDGDLLPVESHVRIFHPGWESNVSVSPWAVEDLEFSRDGTVRKWSGRVAVRPGRYFRYSQTLVDWGAGAELRLRVTAEDDVDNAGVLLFVDAPVDVFAGGRCRLLAGEENRGDDVLPATQPADSRLRSAIADRAGLVDAAGNTKLGLKFTRRRYVTVQDNRQWDNPHYSVYVDLANGPLSAGQSASVRMRLRLEGRVDHSPVRLSVDAEQVLYHFDGFGGNYCFQIESPVTRYTLDNLRLGWARTQMTLALWEPENDNDSPARTDRLALGKRDSPRTALRRELMLALELQRKRIPYCISIWDLPEWLYAEPGKGADAHGRRVPPGKWPELLESIGSYLVYAKDHYGVEPDLLSFNECDQGVRVLFTPREHRDVIKRLGARLAGLGLKTRMTLGDIVARESAIDYLRPTLDDPKAMLCVGALAMHCWGGATRAQYEAWAAMAERLRLPLLVTEVGVDSDWRIVKGWIDSPYYALQELRIYQDLLRYARPQATLQWELTGDYAVVNAQQRLEPTTRYWQLKHLCNLTPPGADALATTSGNDKVLCTAFAGNRGFTLHVANLGAARPAVITGLPTAIDALRAVRTGGDESFRELEPVTVLNGAAAFTLAPQSLLTLTTLELETAH